MSLERRHLRLLATRAARSGAEGVRRRLPAELSAGPPTTRVLLPKHRLWLRTCFALRARYRRARTPIRNSGHRCSLRTKAPPRKIGRGLTRDRARPRTDQQALQIATTARWPSRKAPAARTQQRCEAIWRDRTAPVRFNFSGRVGVLRRTASRQRWSRRRDGVPVG